MTKSILCVGINIASDDVTEADFTSNASLLDWDIVLFRPEISSYTASHDYFQGKTCLDESDSFRLRERAEHWRREISASIQSGKTVIIFLPPFVQVYVDTGKRTYSGTGKSQKTTRHVDLFDNLRSLPVDLSPVGISENSIKLVDKGGEILGPYWKEFEESSSYNVVLSQSAVDPCLVTRTGGRVVGGIRKDKTSGGALVLLPDLDFDQDDFYKEEEDEFEWTEKARQFAARLIGSLVALDKSLKSESERTPEPHWAQSQEFTLRSESELRTKLLQLEDEMEALQRQKENLGEQLAKAGRLRGLLYEKGKALEVALIDALLLLGFQAAQYKYSDSEFDVVFESDEGRLIGEAEGKDSKLINVDKLRQLSMNIHEDLQRDEVNHAAKGVLFGNANRLAPLAERGAAFTEKCVSAALTSNTALVRTSDLYTVAAYLSDEPDSVFASECRNAIVKSVGVVTFPIPPTSTDTTTADDVSDLPAQH
jgi:hypothetical protein